MDKIREFGEYFVNATIIAGMPSWFIIIILNKANAGWNIPPWVALIFIGIAIGYQYGKEPRSANKNL